MTDHTERNAEIAQARRDGTASLSELADRYGISRERVRQISRSQGVNPTEAAYAFAQNNQVVRQRVVLPEDAAMKSIIYWSQGLDFEDIAKKLRAEGINANTNAVRQTVRERATEQTRALRRAARSQAANIHYSDGPRDVHRTPREGRHWTPQEVLRALVEYAKKHDGKLASARAYEVDARCDDSLPSLSTIRNRLGRFTTVRLMVYEELGSDG